MNRTLTITIDPDWEANLREVARQSVQGGYQGEYLNFSSPSLFFGRLTEKRWELVQAMQKEGGMGVRALARHVERDVRRVHDDVAVLLELGLLEKDDKGKLLCPYTDIHVDMHLQGGVTLNFCDSLLDSDNLN